MAGSERGRKDGKRGTDDIKNKISGISYSDNTIDDVFVVFLKEKEKRMLFQFKIQIKGITKPPVWRTVTVPSNYTFLQFHDVIQTAFGWSDCHLFEFLNKGRNADIRISLPEDDFFEEMEDAAKVRLSDVFGEDCRRFFYVYDFGDDWVHEITLESITNKKSRIPACLSGKGACPPEDCGGTYGYEEIKRIFETMPASQRADEYRGWLGLRDDEVWDAEAFDVNKVNTIFGLR